MFKRNNEDTKEKIKAKILLGIELPQGNEPITKDLLLKIIDNIADEILEIKKTSTQSIHM